MPNDKQKGTGEPGWTKEEKGQGAPTSNKASAEGEAGDAMPKAGYGGDERAATEAAAAQVEEDSNGKAGPDDRKG